MVSDVVNENIRLCDIDVTSFRIRLSHSLPLLLSIEQFYDGPKVVPCPSYNYNTSNSALDDSIDQTSYLFTNFEAGKYKTWIVTKITSKQKLRKRIFTIDHDEVLITHMSPFHCCSACSARSLTYIDIASIESIVMERDPPFSFTIKYLEDYYSDDEDDGTGTDSKYFQILLCRYAGRIEVHCCE